jgi:O-antigen ligase
MMYPAAVLCALGLLTAQYMVGRGSFPFLPLPAYFVLAAAALAGLAAVFRKEPALPRLGCVVFATVLAAWVAVPLVEQRLLWNEGGALRMVLAAAAVYGLLAFAITETGPRMVFLLILLAGAAVQGCLGAYQYMNPDAKIDLGWISELCPPRVEGHAFRARGFYYNANHLAWLLNFAGAFALALGAWGRLGAWVRALMLYAAAMFFASGILTQSRGGLLGAGAALLVFALAGGVALFHGAWGARGRAFGIAVLSLLVCGGAAWFALSTSDLAQFRVLTAPEEGYRTTVWMAALRQWQLEPLFGTGLGSFVDLTRSMRLRGDLADDIFAHNDWVQALAETGLAGAGLGLCALVLHFAAGWRAFGSDIRQRMGGGRQPTSLRAAIQLGAMCAAAALAVHSFFDFNMQIPANLLLLAACLGILASPARRHAEKPAVAWGMRACALLPAACGLALVWFSFQAWVPERQWILADNAARNGELDKALELLRTGTESNPDHARLWESTGRNALTLAKKLPATDPRRTELLIEARVAFTNAKKLEHRDAWHHILLGHTRDNIAPSPVDDQMFIDAIMRAPTFSTPFEYYALHLELSGRREEAARAYALALAFPGATFSRQRLDAIERSP